MASVTAVNVVLGTQQEGLSDDGSFLTEGQVGRAVVTVFDSLIVAPQLDFVQHTFEGPNDGHVTKDVD